MNKNNISGIYCIRNKSNNKKYIGSSKSVHYRWRQQHLTELRKNKHGNGHLQHAWNKYGEDSFEFIIVEECSLELLVEREGFWIEHHKSWDRSFGYNLNRYIENQFIISNETRQIMSKSAKELWKNKQEMLYTTGIYLKVVNLFKGGVSKNKIAEKLGIDRNSVYRALEYNKLHKNTGRGKIVKLTQEKKNELTTLREQGMSWLEICKKTGISRTQVNRSGLCHDNQFNHGKRTQYKTFTDEVKKKALKLRSEGKTWKEIASETGVHESLFFRHGLNIDSKDVIRKTITTEIKNEVIRLRGQGTPYRQIGEQLKISQGSISRILKS